jgi:uncharacterized protein YwgA
MAKITSSKDILMLLLYSKGHTGKQCEPIRGRTRLMKMVFLFDREVRQKFGFSKTVSQVRMPDFKPYDFGPFSAQVFSDLEFLQDLGFVCVEPVDGVEPLPEEGLEYSHWQSDEGTEDDVGEPVGGQEYSLSPLGRSFVHDELLSELAEEQQGLLDEFKRRCTGVPLRALLRYVYDKYPDMTTKSKIRQEIESG